MPGSVMRYLALLDEQREAIFHELGPLPEEVLWYRSVLNQDGKVVQDGEVITLVECRPPVRESRTEATAATPSAPTEPSSNGSV